MTSIASSASPKPSPASAEPAAQGRQQAATPAGPVIRAWMVGAALAATLAALLAVDLLRPYGAVYGWFAPAGDAVPQRAVTLDPATCDPKHGSALRDTLTARPPIKPGAQLILFTGNSQQFTVTLPRGATAATPARIASDLFADRLEQRAPGRFAVYNAAAPNLNGVEQLWQGLYWFELAQPRPTAIVIASSFDTYRKAGIRYGLQTLLELPGFEPVLAAFDLTGKPYADEFRSARKAHAELEAEGLATAQSSEPDTLEEILRAKMAAFRPYGLREERKVDFLALLYGTRVAIGLTPTSKRHISGQPMAANWAALQDYVALARAHGAAVFIYNAPVNPAVSLFYPEEYAAYQRALAELVARESAVLVDLAGSIPAERWGDLLAGPDPIHFDAEAHARIAEQLERAIGPRLAALPR